MTELLSAESTTYDGNCKPIENVHVISKAQNMDIGMTLTKML